MAINFSFCEVALYAEATHHNKGGETMDRANKIDRMIAEFLLEMMTLDTKANFKGIKSFPSSSKIVGEAVVDEDMPHNMGSIEIAPVIYDESKKDPVVRSNVLEGEGEKKNERRRKK